VIPSEEDKEKLALAEKDFGIGVFFYQFIAHRRSAVNAAVIIFVAFGENQKKSFSYRNCPFAFRTE
jgi:hypothetical protein